MQIKPPTVRLLGSQPTLNELRASVEHFEAGTREFDVNVVVFAALRYRIDVKKISEVTSLDPEFVERVLFLLERSDVDLRVESLDWFSKDLGLAHGSIVSHVLIGVGDVFRTWDDGEYVWHNTKAVSALHRAHACDAVIRYSRACDACRAKAAR